MLFNCRGDLKRPEDTIPELLEKQVCSSVYLEDTIHRMADLGVDTVVEIGPGRACLLYTSRNFWMRATAPERGMPLTKLAH